MTLLSASRKSIKRIGGTKVIVAFFMLLSCWGYLLFFLHQLLPELNDGTDLVSSTFKDGAPPVVGIYSNIASDDGRKTEFVYALPTTKYDKPVGIAMLLHGCSHSALKFFSPSSKCRQCIGLSEEIRIARILLNQGYAVLAVTSQDRKSGCWGQTDLAHVKDVLEEFRSNTVPDLPSSLVIYAFGASSGGRFAAELAANGMVDAAFVGVMSLGPSLRDRLTTMGNDMPPIYLSPMPRDEGTTNAVKEDYLKMAMASGSAPVVLDTRTCVPLPVTAEYLNERVPFMTKAMAKLIVSALTYYGHLNATTGKLVKDPTKSDWRKVLQDQCGIRCLKNQPLGPGVSPLAKALHRAWAFHEYCSEATLKALEFFHDKLG